MFKTRRAEREATQAGDETRDWVLEVALELFRKHGFEATTMRHIAKGAGLSVGAAYYYFPSKEALVHAYWARVQEDHRQAVKARAGATLEKRVEHALVEKLKIIEPNRALLGALFRFAGEPEHELSLLGDAATEIRAQAIDTFAAVLAGEPLPEPLDELAPRALWFLHLGLVWYAIYDRSRGCRRTYRLAREAASLFCRLLRLAQLPGASIVLEPALRLVAEARL